MKKTASDIAHGVRDFLVSSGLPRTEWKAALTEVISSLERNTSDENANSGTASESTNGLLAVARPLPEKAPELVKGARYSAEQLELIAREDSTLFARHNRYDETLEAYKKDPTNENAASLRAAFKSLREKQRKLGLTPERADQHVALATSQLRPSRAKAKRPTHGRPQRGRPRLSLT